MKWLIDKIESLRQIGFFENESNQVLIDRITRASKSHYYGDITRLESHPDLLYVLTSYDKEKTWFIENESYPPENTWVMESGLKLVYDHSLEFKKKFYYEVFNRLEGISSGIFRPNSLEIEQCGYCDGIAERFDVNFLLGEQAKNLNFCIDNPRLLLHFLVELNELIEDSGYSFVHYIERNHISFFIYFFNSEQKVIFDSLVENPYEHYRNYTNYWHFKAQFNEQQGHNRIAYDCYKKAISIQENLYTISTISDFARFLNEQGKIEESRNLYKKGLSLINNRVIKYDTDEYWRERFEESLED